MGEKPRCIKRVTLIDQQTTEVVNMAKTKQQKDNFYLAVQRTKKQFEDNPGIISLDLTDTQNVRMGVYLGGKVGKEKGGEFLINRDGVKDLIKALKRSKRMMRRRSTRVPD